ncbi:hypothetical protein D3C84_499710 [compost metagenome]
MGEEVFAKSVAEVCEKLGELGLQAEELDSANSRLHEVSTHCATVEQELERLRAELGECKGEYDRAANKVDALRDQLAEAHALFSDVLSIDIPRTAQSLERMRSILSGSAEPATIEYRLLAAGDTITATDEYLEDDAATWSPVRPGIFNGMKYIMGAMVPVRRAITSAELANKEGGV